MGQPRKLKQSAKINDIYQVWNYDWFEGQLMIDQIGTYRSPINTKLLEERKDLWHNTQLVILHYFHLFTHLSLQAYFQLFILLNLHYALVFKFFNLRTLISVIYFTQFTFPPVSSIIFKFKKICINTTWIFRRWHAYYLNF